MVSSYTVMGLITALLRRWTFVRLDIVPPHWYASLVELQPYAKGMESGVSLPQNVKVRIDIEKILDF